MHEFKIELRELGITKKILIISNNIGLEPFKDMGHYIDSENDLSHNYVDRKSDFILNFKLFSF